jgi:hypothetical protein
MLLLDSGKTAALSIPQPYLDSFAAAPDQISGRGACARVFRETGVMLYWRIL